MPVTRSRLLRWRLHPTAPNPRRRAPGLSLVLVALSAHVEVEVTSKLDLAQLPDAPAEFRAR